MGGGGDQKQSGTQKPTIPSWLKPLLTGSATNWQDAMSAAGPQLAGLLNPNPQQIAPLGAGEQADITSLQNIANGPMITPEEQQAEGLINQLTGGPIGSSPDTLAAMRAYQQNVAPTIASSLAATGGGRGGADVAALTQGETTAYAPLIQQEVANREAAIGQLTGLGNTLANRQQTDLSTALTAEGMPRQIAQAQDDAAYQDFLRRSGLIQQFTLGPLQTFGGGLLGSNQQSNSTSAPGMFGK